jgi:molecular chaperone GrpE
VRPRDEKTIAVGDDDAKPADFAPEQTLANEGEAASEQRPPGDDPGAPAAAPLPEPVEALRRERDQLKDQLLRKRADFENYRKRVERDRNLAATEATVKVLRGLMPTLDNLERALQAGGTPTSLREGVELILRDLTSLLESSGVVIEDPLGKPFDPERHQALSHEPVPGFDEGTIVEVFRKGYLLNDRLLRPALVKVAKGEPSGPGNTEAVH